MIKAVIFDLDNTLFDFMSMKREAIDSAIRAMIDSGLSLTEEQIKSAIQLIYEKKGIEYQKVFDELLYDALGKIDYRILSSGIIAYRRAREAALIPYPHVGATLTKLAKKGLKLAILSDAPAREAWLRLCYMGYQHLFDAVLTSDDTGVLKPNPKSFLAVLEKLDVKPNEAIMVGDWFERDMIGAKNVGIYTAFAKYGSEKPFPDNEANYTLDVISQLIDIINVINYSE